MALWATSELQLSLIASGAALVAAVWVYNKWQEFRQRRLAKRMFRDEHADVLLGEAADAASPTHQVHEARDTEETRNPHERTNQRPSGAKKGLLIAYFDIPPHEEIEQFPVFPDLAKTK